MTKTTAYSILKELGNDLLRQYIYNQLPYPQFNSHDFTNSFAENFQDHFNRMLELHRTEGNDEQSGQIVSRLMGVYLGMNRKALMIEKIGENPPTLNINSTYTKTSLWRKTITL